MRKSYTENRVIYMDQLRALCIENDWYTKGTNREYADMLYKTIGPDGNPANMTTERIAEIASDIYQHSEIEDYDETHIMFFIARTCNTFFSVAE